MDLKPPEKATNFEILFTQLIKNGQDVALDSNQTEIRIWCEDYCLVLTESGKWKLE